MYENYDLRKNIEQYMAIRYGPNPLRQFLIGGSLNDVAKMQENKSSK